MTAARAYAAGTDVPADRSRAEIERVLTRFGATGFGYAWSEDHGAAQVVFEAHGRRIRFSLPMPDSAERRFTVDGRNRRRSPSSARAAHEQEVRRLWRALLLVIKAKLESSASGITTFEEEFLAHIVLPDGSTVGEWAVPQLGELYSSGQMPALLPGTEGR
jgi:hypothetical protein